MRWDEQALNNQRVAGLHTLKAEGDGLLIIDDMGFPKQGKDSVGVARQYSGALGKVDNCQVTVNLTYAERTISWPLTTRLYLPESWANAVERRTKAHVPDGVGFQTKAEIALDLLDWALEQGISFAAVTSDADCGDQPFFLDQLERRELRYVMPVRRDFTVRASLERAPEHADALIAAQSKRAWQTIGWREGSNGRLRARFVVVHGWRDRRVALGSGPVDWRSASPPAGRRCALVLEQLLARDAAGQTGGVCPSPPSGWALPPGRQDLARMGPISGTALGRLPPPRGSGHAGL